jgi:hypothetical protein
MYLQTLNTLVTVILLDPLLFTLLIATDVIESAFLKAFSDIRLWQRSPCLQRTQDVGFLFLFIKPNSKPFTEHFSSFTSTSLPYVFVVLNSAHMTTSLPKVPHHGVYPEPQSIILHFQVHCPNLKKTDVITKFCITVLTLETVSQFATKLCVGRIHLFLKKREIVSS